MNEKRIRAALQDALDEKIPPSQIDLWPTVKANFGAGNYQKDQQGAKMNRKKVYRVRRFALAGAMFVALMAAALLTPQGRALSQSILQFFAQTEDTALPLAPSEIAEDRLEPSAATAAPPSPLIGVAEAGAQVGFDVAELPVVPDGLDYLGARLYGDTVSVEYQTPDYAGHLIIMQSQQGFNQSKWDSVPAHAIVPVKIGALDGEFIQGRFVVYAGETVGTWEPDAPILRLRWLQDGVWFEMTKSGYAEALAYLDQASMIELAESLAVKP